MSAGCALPHCRLPPPPHLQDERVRRVPCGEADAVLEDGDDALHKGSERTGGLGRLCPPIPRLPLTCASRRSSASPDERLRWRPGCERSLGATAAAGTTGCG